MSIALADIRPPGLAAPGSLTQRQRRGAAIAAPAAALAYIHQRKKIIAGKTQTGINPALYMGINPPSLAGRKNHDSWNREEK